MSKNAADKIRKIHAMYKGLDEIADMFDELEKIQNHKAEYAKAIDAAKGEVEAAKAEAAKVRALAAEDAAAIRAEAEKRMTDADRVFADAKATASKHAAEAAAQAKTLTEKAQAELAVLEAKIKGAQGLIADKVREINEAESKLAKIQAAVAKIVGG